jgi:hypothetical protein
MGWDIVRRESNPGGGARKREPPPAAPGAHPAERRPGADTLQRPLRSRFRGRLPASVSWHLCNFQSRRGASWLSRSIY